MSNKIITILLILLVLVVSTIIIYELRNDEKVRQENINYCMADTYQGFEFSWNLVCEQTGREDDCKLSGIVVKELYDNFKDRRAECSNRY